MDAKTELCCLLGRPVEHSLSPLIHNTIASRMGINTVYTAFSVADDKLDEAVKGAYALGVRGMNVTVPHKCNVIKSLAAIDPTAEKIGAVNTLVKTDDGYKGYNTDIIGLGRELSEAGVEIKNRPVIILGAGGASRAITHLCRDMGADRIYLLNRSVSKAEELAAEINFQGSKVAVPMALCDYKKIPAGKYPVIQTTSVGLYPDIYKAPIEDDAFYELVSAGVDIIFNPKETAFMKKCSACGALAYNGLKMLLYQAVASFELWFGISVEKELIGEVYELLERKMKTDE